MIKCRRRHATDPRKLKKLSAVVFSFFVGASGSNRCGSGSGRKMTVFTSPAAASSFNSLIPTPSVPSLIGTEPVELLCRASNISSTDPFCFVKQKQETVEAFLLFFIYKYA